MTLLSSSIPWFHPIKTISSNATFMGSDLLARIASHAQSTPSKKTLTFVNDAGKVIHSITASELESQTLSIASQFQSSAWFQSQTPDRNRITALLVYPPGLEFILAFIACLRAGITAVPVYPPDILKLQKDIDMFISIAKDCRASIVLTCKSYAHAKKLFAIKDLMSSSHKTAWPEHLEWIVTDAITSSFKQIPILKSPAPTDIAFLQYTSGSTGSPKGVMLTHANIDHNLKVISSALHATKDTVVVSWLPQYHDMGLIGAYLGTIFNGGSGIYMSPYSFIKDPMLWMRLISEYRATHLQAPNFAYALCARKSEHLKTQLDLSSVRHMINGAEPVQSAAIDSFYAAFERYGLSPNVIHPTYGLAEHTVFVCGGKFERIFVDKQILICEQRVELCELDSGKDRREMIGCGRPNEAEYGIHLCIVDVETMRVLESDRVGEIWVCSPSKAAGYVDKELSDPIFCNRLAPENGRELDRDLEFLRTGDLGFLHNGTLFLCGRLKDLIIVRGKNHYPQDLEATVESFSEIRPGCSAAFACLHSESKEEELVIVAELYDPNMNEKSSLSNRIRASIANEHGVKCRSIVLIQPRSILKTTSGKISRSRCQFAYENNRLDILFHSSDILPSELVELHANKTNVCLEPANEVQQFLLTEIAQLLDVGEETVDLNVPLQALGMDSMSLTQLQGIISQRFHVHIQEEILYGQHTTLRSLQAAIQGNNDLDTPVSPPQPSKPSARRLCHCFSC